LIKKVLDEEPISIFENGILGIKLNLQMLQEKSFEDKLNFQYQQAKYTA